MKDIKRRLSRLEQANATKATVYVWAAEGEMSAQAIAGQFPAGLADGATVTVLRWAAEPIPCGTT